MANNYSELDKCPMCGFACVGGAHRLALVEDRVYTKEQFENLKVQTEFRVEVRSPTSSISRRTWFSLENMCGFATVEAARVRRDAFLAAPELEPWEAKIVKVTTKVVE